MRISSGVAKHVTSSRQAHRRGHPRVQTSALCYRDRCRTGRSRRRRDCADRIASSVHKKSECCRIYRLREHHIYRLDLSVLANVIGSRAYNHRRRAIGRNNRKVITSRILYRGRKIREYARLEGHIGRLCGIYALFADIHPYFEIVRCIAGRHRTHCMTGNRKSGCCQREIINVFRKSHHNSINSTVRIGIPGG